MRTPVTYILLLAACLARTLPGRAAPARDSIPAGDDDTLRTVHLQEVVKTARAADKLRSAQLGVTVMDQRLVKNVPALLGEADVIKALQLQPGVSAGVEGFAGMYVRGGENDENMFLIDGNPVYQMNHLGGLFSAYNAEAVSGLAFYKAAFPARYGGRLSSVTDISLKGGDPDQRHGNFTVGLTSANLSLSGPLARGGRTTYAAALRRSWFELVSVPALAVVNASKKKSGEKQVAGYGFTDLNLKVDHRTAGLGTLSWIGYYGHDRLKTGEHRFSNDKEAPYRHENENRLGWGNLLTALKWRLPLGHTVTVDTKASFTRYGSTFRKDVTTDDGDERAASRKKVVNGITDLGAETALTFAPADGETVIRAGAKYTHHRFSPENVTRSSADGDAPRATKDDLRANEWDCYAEADFLPLPWLRANAGVRGSFFRVQGKGHAVCEPRLSAAFLLSEKVSLKAGYARMSQFVQQVSDSYVSLPTDYWMPVTGRLAPLTSDQLSAGVYYSPAPRLVFSLEGYHKRMHHLLEYRDGYRTLPPSTPWDEKLTSGSGRAYGIDFQAEADFGRVSGFLGYGLMWSDRRFADLNGGKSFPSKYDNRHKLTLSATWNVSERVDLNAGWVYQTGNRTTLSLENYAYPEGYPTTMVPSYPPNREEVMPNYYEGKNNVRLPAYHRLDLGVNIRRPKRNGRTGVWNISVYNAYSRMNPVIIEKNNDLQTMEGKHLRPRFRKFSLFPAIPSVSYTYKF